MKKLFPVFLFACCAALLWICAARAETETVLALSDTHLTKKTQDHASMMLAVIHAAAGKDLVLMTGDNTNNSRPEEHELLEKESEDLRELALPSSVKHAPPPPM